ncbi:MAG: hypothetical protein RMH97_08525 [Verrucomicrobiales bacterium]|nr:hypothetical protein [Verrucomicrobiales bacterium]
MAQLAYRFGTRFRLFASFAASAVGVAAICLVAGQALAQEATNQPPLTQVRGQNVDYSAFRIITERNIFAARRSGRVTRSAAPRPQRQVETLSLVGTLEAGNGPVAFFDGSSAEYRKAVKPGGKIAGFTVASVNFKGVVLQNDREAIELRVGAQLRMQEDGRWHAASADQLAAETGSAVAGSTAPRTNESADSASADTASDVLRRLMQERERELQ